ncbi:MAG: hypothetical protein ACI4YB_08320 [Oscillospiraceae bacterium]
MDGETLSLILEAVKRLQELKENEDDSTEESLLHDIRENLEHYEQIYDPESETEHEEIYTVGDMTYEKLKLIGSLNIEGIL